MMRAAQSGKKSVRWGMSHLGHGEVKLSHEGLQYDGEAVMCFVASGVDQFSHDALHRNAHTASGLSRVDQRVLRKKLRSEKKVLLASFFLSFFLCLFVCLFVSFFLSFFRLGA